MNKEQLKNLLAIARPAIVAVYGRGRDHTIASYNIMSDGCVWIEVERREGDGWGYSYKLRIENGVVTYLKRV